MKTIKGVKRFDIGEIGQVELTPQGFLKVTGFATRTGVFTYRDRDGQVRRELRHPDDVFDPESLQTLKYAPITIEHPPVMLTPDNVSQYSKGHATERVEVNRDLVETDLIIEAKDAIDTVVQNKKRELSSGYNADIIPEEGVFNGAPYDCRQKNIRYNHIAIVDRGRAGPEVRIRLDSQDAIMEPNKDSGVAETMKEFAKGKLKSGSGQKVTDPKQAAAIGYSEQRGDEQVQTPASEHTPEGENDRQDDEGAQPEESTREVVVSGKTYIMPNDLADIVEDMLDRYDEFRGTITKLEESMGSENKDKKDADISQKNISPQVKVEQKAPDGRSGASKVGPGDRSGAAKAKGLDAEEEKKEDGDEHEVVGGVQKNGRDDDDDDAKKDDDDEKEKKDYEGLGGEGAAASPVQQLKDQIESMKSEHAKQLDSMQAKIDEFASASMGSGEHKMDSKSARSSKSFRDEVRRRVNLERQAEKILDTKTVEKFDSMSDDEIRAAVIKARHPQAELRGKSSVYLESRFDSIMESIEGSESVRREMGRAHLESARFDAGDAPNPEQKRRESMKEARGMWTRNLSQVKK